VFYFRNGRKYTTISSIIGTGTWTRTKINGFGDRYSAIELCP
jgi:hypothetical protein